VKSVEIYLKQLLPGDAGRFVRDGLAAIVILVLVLIAYFWIARGLKALSKYGGLSQQTARVLQQIAGWTLVTLGTLLSLQQFGLISNVWASKRLAGASGSRIHRRLERPVQFLLLDRPDGFQALQCRRLD
jgi:hypothetical protein